ncbi:TonB-dependent receptor [Chitinophaga sancti]|uniref:SusC/RagA family TonB-linked outer membrane protein n=1 Tax=Chitinophaga sancti TaxID=1004 RepID=UPI002A75D41A|nr:TonB-dependent receptor [Chitinophaga sancti]WPQ63251.1 TonB-dependent receptor [Chitinophaga sancti]
MHTDNALFSTRVKHAFAATMALLLLVTSAMARPSSGRQELHKMLQRFQVQQGSLSTALKQLESAAQISLAYDEDALRKVQVHANTYRKTAVIAILQDLLNQSSLKFEERYNTILIYDSAASLAHTSLQQAANDITITGSVSDKNGPLIGATVFVKGTTKGTHTDASGQFKLTVPENATITITMIGYKSADITIGAERTFNIVLQENSLNLNQLVVVGYGTQRKATVSGAIADVQMDKLTSRSLNDVTEALQGKAAGVIVSNNGGDPTSKPTVYVRGLGGINGESALYVVDGSIYTGGPINPNDIESINVLKDASAAIYGARASGGVILITTKKGKSGTATVSVDAKTGWQWAAKKLDVLTAKEFADVENTAYDAAGIARADAFNADIYPDGQITRTDWQDQIFRTGKIQDYNIGVNGGTDKNHYYMGFGYRNNEGILLNTNSERYTFRLNSDAQIKPWLKIGENMSYTYNNGNGANTTSPYTGVIFTALGYPRNVTPYTATGAFSGLPAAYAGSYGDLANPVATLMRLDSKTPVNAINLNPYAELTLTKDLTFRSNFSVTKSFSDQKTFTTRALEIGKINSNNSLVETIQDYSDILSEQTLNYAHRFGLHNINAVAGYTYQHHTEKYLIASANSFSDERDVYRYFDNAAAWSKPSSGIEQDAVESFLARVNYDYNNRYLFTILGRRDGSSRVAAQNRYQNYYSVSGGWVLSDEDFMKDIKWLSIAKLRASYGVLGNLGSVPANALNVNLASVSVYTGAEGTLSTGLAENALSNPNLKWAESKQLNFGTDLAFFKNQLSLTADYFIKTTTNMVMQVNPPSTAGVSEGMYKNMGEARDKGIELGLNYNGKFGKDFTYGVGATMTKVTNKLLSLQTGLNEVVSVASTNIRSSLTPLVTRVGNPQYSFNVIKTAGIFQSQAEVDSYVGPDGVTKIQPNAKAGDRKFVDKNNDGVIDNNDRQIVGSFYPGFTYGFSLNAAYKGFDLNIFAQGVHGNKIFNALKYTNMNPSIGTNYNMLKGILDAWTPTHTNTDVTRVISTDLNGNYGNTSDWYIEDGSYLRIKNVTLGYTLPVHLTNAAKIGAVRIYATANNLLTFTKYKGYDPEVGMDNYGIDVARYPQSRSFLLGLNVNF